MADPDLEPNGPEPLDFGEWYGTVYPRLAAALTVIGRDRELARDAAAEACARALERWERVRTMAAPDAWTFRVGLNVLRRLQRRAAVERRLLRRLHPTTDIAPAELEPGLWNAVRALPVRQREAIVLRYVLDLEQHEIADVMGVSPGTIASTLHAARARLQAALGGADPDDRLSEVE
jgi:RNA polymerase sigma-70 factor (ECF subfamily)